MAQSLFSLVDSSPPVLKPRNCTQTTTEKNKREARASPNTFETIRMSHGGVEETKQPSKAISLRCIESLRP